MLELKFKFYIEGTAVFGRKFCKGLSKFKIKEVRVKLMSQSSKKTVDRFQDL